MKKILIIAAHPDDEILGCGGFISKYQSLGSSFRVLFVGEGSTCRFPTLDSKESQAAVMHRSESAIAALASLNINDIEFNDLPCGRLDQIPIISINKIIERSISNFKPDTVLTHSPCDVNNDHKIVFNSTLMSTRPGALNHISTLMSYEVLSSSEWSFIDVFKPNYFEELSAVDIDRKCAALALYSSEIKEFPFPRSINGVKNLAMMRGMQSGLMYAEAFNIIRKFQK